jgi:hypothetical protein
MSILMGNSLKMGTNHQKFQRTRTISVSDDLWDAAKVRAKRLKKANMSDYVRDLIAADLTSEVIRHSKSDHADAIYEQAAKKMMAESFGFPDFDTLKPTLHESTLADTLRIFTAKARALEFSELSKIMKGVGIGESPSSGIRISPAPSGGVDATATDEKPGIDPPEEGQSDGKDEGRKRKKA